MTQPRHPGSIYPALAAALSFPGISHLPSALLQTFAVDQLPLQLSSLGTAPSAHWNLTEGPLARVELPPSLTPLYELLDSQREKTHAIAHLLRWEAGVKKSAALLREAGLSSPIVLKGGSNKYTLYPTPHLRTSSDVDLLLPLREVELATKALTRSGYSLVVTDRRRPYTAVHGHQVLLRKGPAIVELHRAIDNLGRPSFSYDELLSDASPLASLDPWLYAPTLESSLLVAAAHALKHGLLIPLRDLVDIQLALETQPLNETLLKSRAKDTHLHEVLAFLVLQAGTLSGRWSPLHSSLVEALPTTATFVYDEWRHGGNGLGDGSLRKLLTHAALTPGSSSTRRLLTRFVQRRLRDFLTK
jgi:hypothetical protein